MTINYHRKRFEDYMRSVSPCVRLARQMTDGRYRTTTVQKAWAVWCMALEHPEWILYNAIPNPPERA